MQLDHKHLVLRAEVTNCPKEESLHEILSWMKSLIENNLRISNLILN